MALYDTTVDFRGTVYRNITSARASIDPFDDLVDDDAGRAVAIAAEMRVRGGPTGVIHRGLAYSEAIDYPFSADRTVASRFGDGSNRVWYGACDEDTALAETCYHQIVMLREIEGIMRPVTRYRKVYAVRAQGLMLDLRRKHDEHPEIIGQDYAPTQAIGKRVSHEGLPGLLYPSARWPDGECLATFRADPLSDAKALYALTYHIDAPAGEVAIERKPGVLLRRLSLTDLRRHRVAGARREGARP